MGIASRELQHCNNCNMQMKKLLLLKCQIMGEERVGLKVKIARIKSRNCEH